MAQIYTKEVFYIAMIDATSTGTVEILTAPSDSNLAINSICVKAAEAADVTTPPVISIGTNDSDYNNVVSSDDMAGLTDTTKNKKLDIYDKNIDCVEPGDVVKLKVDTAADATTYNLCLLLSGVYV